MESAVAARPMMADRADHGTAAGRMEGEKRRAPVKCRERERERENGLASPATEEEEE